jgi:succinate dehydrogenase/fumarate reductase cytochrome b subunit
VLTLFFSWNPVTNEYKPLEDTSKKDGASTGYAFTLHRLTGMQFILALVFCIIMTSQKASLIQTLGIILSSSLESCKICYIGPMTSS